MDLIHIDYILVMAAGLLQVIVVIILYLIHVQLGHLIFNNKDPRYLDKLHEKCYIIKRKK